METLSSAIEARVFDSVRKGGYDRGQVDRFMTRAAAASLDLEEQLTAAYGQINGLERQVGETKDADRAVGVAFLAAADAKDRLIEEAERRAKSIVDRARLDAAELSVPRRELETERKEVDELRARAVQAKALVDEEADELLIAARKQADRIVAEARRVRWPRLKRARQRQTTGYQRPGPSISGLR